jgi:hypothetical protein
VYVFDIYYPRTTNVTDSHCTKYNDSVVGDGSNYDDAYFEINNVRIYTDVPVSEPTSTVVLTTTAAVVGATEATDPSHVSSTQRGSLGAFSLVICAMVFGVLLVI